MFIFVFTAIMTAMVAIVYASFFEWALHKYLMHRPLCGLRYAFERHALVHHTTFKADRSYHLCREEDKHTIPMAWWNILVLAPVATSPFFGVSMLYGEWTICTTAFLVVGAYYGVYEYLHWCMHLPKERRVERTGFFFRLNGHHVLHHRYPHKNLNVVLPIADWCLGTLLLRSPFTFSQVRGKMVPDLQPR